MQYSKLIELPDEEVSHNARIKKRVMLKTGDLPHLIGFSQARFPAGEMANRHKHDDMYEVFYVEQGVGRIRVDDQEIALEPGVCVSVEPGENHEIENTGNEELVVNYFGFTE